MRLLLFILAFIPTASNASILQKLSNPALENVANFASAYEKDSGLFTRRSQFVSVIRARKTLTNLRQEIQDLRTITGGEYSSPSHIGLKPLHNREDIEEIVFALFTHQNSFTEVQMNDWQQLWMSHIPNLTPQLKSYLSIDSNSFGGCRTLIFEDLTHQEILFIGNCYSE